MLMTESMCVTAGSSHVQVQTMHVHYHTETHAPEHVPARVVELFPVLVVSLRYHDTESSTV